MTAGTLTDRYPTRTGEPAGLQPRADPVVYTSGTGPLSSEQVEHFDRLGFLVIEDLVDAATVRRVHDEVERLAAQGDLAASERVVLEPDGDDVRSIFEVHRISQLMAEMVSDDRLVGPARQLLGSSVYIHQSRVNRKPGFAGNEFAWHSDFETWHAEDGMPAPRAVSLSLALTTNYVHNGSLMIIPGSHRTYVPTASDTPQDHYRQSLRRQEVGVPDREALTALVETGGGIAVVTGQPGSAVLFDSNAMHGSAGNITPYPRSNLFVVYNSMDNTLGEPFAAPGRRPEFIASRRFVPVGS